MSANAAVKRFAPLMDRILVHKMKQEAKTASGILLPEASKKALNMAKVVAAGPGRVSREGVKIDMSVKIGDTVVIPEYGGMTLKFDDEEYQVFRDEDIVGRIENE